MGGAAVVRRAPRAEEKEELLVQVLAARSILAGAPRRRRVAPRALVPHGALVLEGAYSLFQLATKWNPL